MFSEALTGFREVRTPLTAGYILLTAVWLVVWPELPDTTGERRDRYEVFYELADAIGRPGVLAALSVAAYLIGSVFAQLNRVGPFYHRESAKLDRLFTIDRELHDRLDRLYAETEFRVLTGLALVALSFAVWIRVGWPWWAAFLLGAGVIGYAYYVQADLRRRAGRTAGFWADADRVIRSAVDEGRISAHEARTWGYLQTDDYKGQDEDS